MEYLWTNYGLSMDYLWSIYGVSMEYLWSIYGVSMDYPPLNPLQGGEATRPKITIFLTEKSNIEDN
jgi:hypothetical protein